MLLDIEPRQNFRQHTRYPVFLTASLLKDDWADQHVLGKSDIYNLSLNGCHLFSEIALHPGKLVALRVSLPEQAGVFQVDLASVQWTNGDQCGLEFLIMTTKDEKLLRTYVNSLQSLVP